MVFALNVAFQLASLGWLYFGYHLEFGGRPVFAEVRKSFVLTRDGDGSVLEEGKKTLKSVLSADDAGLRRFLRLSSGDGGLLH